MRLQQASVWLLILLLLAGCAGPALAPGERSAGTVPAPSAGGPADPESTGPESAGDELAGPGSAESGTVTLLFVGDVMLARTPGEHIALGEDPFAGVADLLLGADLTVGNLECAISTIGEPVPKLYNFRCDPESVPLLAAYFDAVSVANNHSGDYGKEAFAQQLALLEAGGVPYFGGGRNLAEAHAPLVVERGGVKIALLGYSNVELREYEAGPDTPGLAWLEPEEVEAAVVAAGQEADVVVVFLHWGREYRFLPDPVQEEWARRWIDAGADLVVGSHPHVTQPVEPYGAGLIAYSLGNFVFDDFLDVPPDLDEPSRTSWMLAVTVNREGLVRWETHVARTDDRGFPQRVEGAASPCSEGDPENGYLCEP